MSEYAEFHDELRAVARELLATPVSWPITADAGWAGLEVPDECGGAAATFAETAVICEELGRAAAPSSYLGSAVLAVPALRAAGADALLGDLAAGAVRVAVVLSGSGAGRFAVHDGRLSGRAEFVPDAAGADRLLVPAVDNGAPVLVDVSAAEVTVEPQPVLDETRRLATVTADAARPEHSWALPPDCVLSERAAVAIAVDSLGVAEAMLAATVSYAGMRQQFGRPIGSFQAVKHACADMLVQVSVARQLVAAAVRDIAGERDASVSAAMAKSYATGAAVKVVGSAMQLHGGIGYTWESRVHVYLKRAALNRSLFGSPAEHRRRLADRSSGFSTQCAGTPLP
ncbi:acyl-CoA/acyl-ACP dehydrogenase [Mycobacterium sp. MYCO198283]|uniref:acyl-CoA dehydrogenase family protein n=1 Tax=Mycobacterium sp. MYCO198283 TaxID=2883505 RepID=UPI001E36475D|nr:acyl-CoA dehydrogenase family protein [Mycobacterium sp. MYCO198283]MCG5431085.1 acyl-CoA/acyl-ACP dehydrogenase [Mycobacterium sp. MYCO198283]